jgi:pimeloyl-ACP methyl ester carboxylesterase
VKAREADASGYVERGGVRVAWQAYGDLARPDDPAVLLLPTWCLLTAEVWKLQVPFLARRTRVITYDPRGNGLSDRPRHPDAYRREELTRDAVDVLEATGTHRAVVVALSAGNAQALDLASEHPERVAAWVAIAPSIQGLGTYPQERATAFDRWDRNTGDDSGWGRYNRYSWIRDYRGFTEFFCDQLVPEAHSTKVIEDLLGWSATTDGKTLVRAEANRRPGLRTVEEQCADVTCPVVVVHGSRDHAVPYEHGVRLAELTGGRLVTFEGSGHVPQGRDPVAVNRLLDDVLSASAERRPQLRRSRPTPAARSRGEAG